MGRFIFTYETDLNNTTQKSVTLEVGDSDITLTELLAEIQNFLRSAGYFFADKEILEVGTERDWSWDKEEGQPEINDLKEWRETNWISKKEEDPFWQKDGQQWQKNGWDETGIDGPIEFSFNGIKEKDFPDPEIKLDPDTQVQVNKMVEEMNRNLDSYYKGE